MAKKSRTPPAPRRRVQAPKVRTSGPTTAGRDRRQLLIAGAGSAALIAVAVIAFLVVRGGDGSSVAAAAKAAGCTLQTAPAREFRPGEIHIPSLTTRVNWNTFPPAAGPHFGSTAIWDFYTEPVNPRLVVHNLEHGGVVIWWGPRVPQSTIEELRRFYDDDPAAMIGTPIRGLGTRVALTAWTFDLGRSETRAYRGEGHVMTCPTFNENAFEAFRDAYRGNGPERIPLDQLQPGGT